MTEILQEGLNLMLLGMGIVFTFLVVLVFALMGMSRIAAALEPSHGLAARDSAAASPAMAPTTPGAGAEIDGEIIAAITAAVARFRATKR